MVSLQALCTRVGNLFRGAPRENIFFLHVPKCGGTSIGHAIRMNYLTLDIRKDRNLLSLDPGASARVVRMIDGTDYPHDSSRDCSILKLREYLLLYFMSQKNTKYIEGHFTFSEAAYDSFFKRYAFVTMLRDPVKRWISTYFYNRYKDGGHFKVDMEIEEYLDSDFGKSQGSAYVKFIGGHNASGDYASAEAIERTKKNLEKFAVIGILENIEGFKYDFRRRFEVDLRIDVKNKNPKPQSSQRAVITPEIEARIKEICRPDYEIYQYAVDNVSAGRD